MMNFRSFRHIATLPLAFLLVPTASARPDAAQTSAAPSFQLEEATIAGIHAALDRGTLTCQQLVGLYLRRISAYEDGGPRLNSITTVNPQALDVAAALDNQRKAGGRRGPLHCIPVLLKDNIDTVDMPTSNGSVILKDARPPDDAYLAKALRAAGAIILGKASMGEFASGSYNTIDGQVKNPYDFGRETGGSSAGSAAAVAANFAMLAIGTDTSTSVRGPASFNGIVGLRPTTGLISRDGVAPKNLNFDTEGPMARSVTDLATLLNVIDGADPSDPLSVEVHKHYPREGTDFTQFLKTGSLKGARLGVARDFFGGDPEIDRLAEAALATLRARGAQLVDIRLDPEFLNFYVRGAGANIRRPSDYGFKKDWETYLATLGPDVPKTVAEFVQIYETRVATSPLPADPGVIDLLKHSMTTSTADPAYRHLIEDVLPTATKLKLAIFDTNRIDALVFPYQSSFAPVIKKRGGAAEAGNESPADRSRRPPDPSTMAGYGSVGFPGIVVPMGFGSKGLPMALSFMGRPYSEARLIGFAYDYEQASHLRRPSPLVPPLAGEAVTPPRTTRK
jgi:amidase